MAGITAAVVDGWLDGSFATTFVGLHTGDPGAAGATSLSVGDATRKSATLGAAADGVKAMTGTAGPWTNGGITEAVSHISLWTASTAGTFTASGALTTPITWGAAAKIRLSSLVVTVAAVPADGAVTHGRQLNTTNTGPEAAGYTLTDWTGSYLFATNGQVITGKRFINVGPQVTANNVVFRGCEFRQTDPNFFVMRLDGQDTLFEDCRWRPDSTSSTPVTFAQSYQQGIKMFTGLGVTVRRCEFWGFGNAIEFGGGNASAAHPITVEECWMHDAADQAGSTYHHDGILSSDGVSWVNVRRCKINSGGNTNAIAFQTPAGGTAWSDIVLQDNQFGGFGYTVNLGDDIPSNNVTFTGNEFDRSIIDPVWGPFKNSWTGFTGTNVWSGNTKAADGLYWWPDDGTATAGHATDYAG